MSAREPGRAVARRPVGTLPALRQAELALAGQDRNLPRRLVRVPLDAVVQVRSTLPVAPGAMPALTSSRAALSHRPLEGPQAGASPARADRGAVVGRTLREAVMLALLAATLAATYYLGRTHAFQNVIIVPEPWSQRSVLS